MSDKRYLNVRYKADLIDEVNVTGMTRLGERQQAIAESFSLGPAYDEGCFLVTPQKRAFYHGLALIEVLEQRRIYNRTIPSLTADFKAFKDAQLVDKWIVSPTPASLPYPSQKLERLYVRQCYKHIFDLLSKAVGEGHENLAITGTPGTGKSLFFVYMLHHLSSKPWMCLKQSPSTRKESSIKPAIPTYATNWKNKPLFYWTLSMLIFLSRSLDTLYAVDGVTKSFLSPCVTVYIGSPMSNAHWSFGKHTNRCMWFLPVWTPKELAACRTRCYPHVPVDVLREQLRMYGGIPRSIFNSDISYDFADMRKELADEKVLQWVCHSGIQSIVHPAAHLLLHMNTSDDGQYRFRHRAFASKYVVEKLWEKYPTQMVTDLQDMLQCRPSEISRHLFEINGHHAFSSGSLSGGNGLQCRNLQTSETSILTLQDFGGVRVPLKQDPIPDMQILRYFERSASGTRSQRFEATLRLVR
ncbi:hypothetical protein BJ741DRAFT_686438 [Chytriomyces cf. hyalinus JEL632]|nr:hypothetical protein BJ741DRAFT_686438 [Chytriomyces cf. hyalinus JEL632]